MRVANNTNRFSCTQESFDNFAIALQFSVLPFHLLVGKILALNFRFEKPRHAILFNLSASDSLQMAVTALAAAASKIGDFEMGTRNCTGIRYTIIFIRALTFIVSSFTLVALSVERCFRCCYRNRSHELYAYKTIIPTLVSFWLCGAICGGIACISYPRGDKHSLVIDSEYLQVIFVCVIISMSLVIIVVESLWILVSRKRRRVESRPVESGPVESGPVESRPVEARPVESGPGESGPVESRPVESKPIESGPVEQGPVESRPVERGPVEPRPVESGPVELGPVDSRPVESRPVESSLVESSPVSNADEVANERKRQNQVAKVESIVVLFYLVCMLPGFCKVIAEHFAKQSPPHCLRILTIYLGMANTILNPFIYGLGMMDTRVAILRELKKMAKFFFGKSGLRVEPKM